MHNSYAMQEILECLSKIEKTNMCKSNVKKV